MMTYRIRRRTLENCMTRILVETVRDWRWRRRRLLALLKPSTILASQQSPCHSLGDNFIADYPERERRRAASPARRRSNPPESLRPEYRTGQAHLESGCHRAAHRRCKSTLAFDEALRSMTEGISFQQPPRRHGQGIRLCTGLHRKLPVFSILGPWMIHTSTPAGHRVSRYPRDEHC